MDKVYLALYKHKRSFLKEPLKAKVGTVKRLEIKCSRCKTINHIN